MDFTQRIRAMHTNAKILMTSDDPPADVVDEHELVITITSLTLSSQAEMLGVDGSVSRVPVRFGMLSIVVCTQWSTLGPYS